MSFTIRPRRLIMRGAAAASFRKSLHGRIAAIRLSAQLRRVRDILTLFCLATPVAALAPLILYFDVVIVVVRSLRMKEKEVIFW